MPSCRRHTGNCHIQHSQCMHAVACLLESKSCGGPLSRAKQWCIYLSYIFVIGPSEREHLKHLEEVLRLSQQLKMNTCVFQAPKDVLGEK